MTWERARPWIIGAAAVVAVGGAILAQRLLRPAALPAGLASGNGRIEATEYDVASRRPGRLAEVRVREGEMVERGQVLARIDSADLEAQRRAAEAELVRSRETRSVAAAVVAQRESEARLARTELARVKALFERTVASQQRLDEAQTKSDAAAAGLVAAREEVHSADASIAAAEANIARIQTDIDDSALAAPVSGRVLYRLAEPGEVLAAGGKVVTLLDLTDVFMTIFLSMAEAGRVRLASEARVVLDPIPEYVIPGSVSFVSPEAQFTPKEVETRSEREMLMFRIKVKLDPAVLEQHLEKVKTGVPGIAYVRLGPEMPDWPPELQVRLPE